MNVVASGTRVRPTAVKLGRAGWLVKGVVYVLAGALAILVVTQASGWSSPTSADGEASPTGAIREVAQSSLGPVLLWALAIGMFVYAAWRVVSAFMPGSTDAMGWATRLGYLVSATLWAIFGITAVVLAMSPDADVDGNRRVTEVTTRIMENDIGRWAIAGAGVITVAAAIYRLRKGVLIDVNDELDLSGMVPEQRRVISWLGAVGEVGRGIALALIGFFLLRSAITFDPDEATGLDGALRRAAEHWWGLALVGVVGVGFVAYGIFCLATFTRRRFEPISS